MKRLSIIIFLTLFSVLSWADNGTWKMYLSYNGEPQDVESADKFIYVQVNNCLYSYNRNDHSIQTFSRLDLLSDIDVQYIAWAKAVKKLVVVYNNGNIDLICNDGTKCENISAYYTKTTTDDKTINSISVYGSTMLMATNFGIVSIDLKKTEIKETYRLKEKFAKAVIDDNYVYGLTVDGKVLYKGDLKKNILDPAQWTKESYSGQVSFSTVSDQINADDKAIVESLNLDDSPKNNQISALCFNNGRLLVAAGGRREGIDDVKNTLKPSVSEYIPNVGWQHFEDFQSAVSIPYGRPVTDIVINPYDKEHMFFCTYGNGLYEYRKKKQVYNYTLANTDAITSAVNMDTRDSYVYTLTGIFTSADELMFINSYNYNPIIRLNLNDKTFKSSFFKELLRDENRSHAGMCGLMKDNRGLYWFGNDSHHHPALYCLDLEKNKLNEFSTFINQDGTSYQTQIFYVKNPIMDFDGNLWIATDQGPFIYTPELQKDPTAGFYQIKVPRNDGTNYADYLLSGVAVNCIAIDGAGRKWFGTNNGVYLISADNMEQVEHFTVNNSMLLSNDIVSIAINNGSGEVFFATDKGLCSYMADATQPNEEMNKDNVWAYPNPVRPDYNGYITITGLSLEARVTITTSSGHIVASGVSTGGSFKWNGCDMKGQRVASGIYMVHSATSTGESGTVCKVAVLN